MIYVFIEGPDDTRFFKRFFHSNAKYIEYAKMKKDKLKQYINSIISMKLEYVFFADSDGKRTDERIDDIITKYPFIQRDKVHVVCYEIESWYYSGVDDFYCRKNGKFKYIHNTNQLNKEKFNSIISVVRKSRLQIMIDMLENYQVDLAQSRNQSFADFYKRKEELNNAV